MKILYGVTGEGLGHAMRSRVMADHLRERGHDVVLAASGRACGYLRERGHVVHEIRGFALAYEGTELRVLRTAARIARLARPAVRDSIALYRRAIAGFQPDVCITDFDSFSHVFGKLFDRPVISLDHHHVISRCRHAHEVKQRLPRDFLLTRAVVSTKIRGCDHYLVSSFYAPQVRARHRDSTTLVGPILRPEVMAAERRAGDHVVVYQTSRASTELVRALRLVRGHTFRVYGLGDGGTDGNVELRGFDEDRFRDDLASARAVITNGGHTVIAEALFHGKPVLSIPIRRQGEQQLNAAYVDFLGFGRTMGAPSATGIAAFLADHERYASRGIAAGNVAAAYALDHLLEEIR